MKMQPRRARMRGGQVAARLQARLLVALLALWTLCLPIRSSLAQGLAPTEGFAVHSLEQQDLDADGLPDLTSITCSFASEHDAVLVYDTAGDMRAGATWEQSTDFENDTWVFDAGADGEANLIIVFGVEAGKHVAYLYTDQDADHQVRYKVTGKKIAVTESRFWTARVVADGPWYHSDGSINRDVTISVDGPTGERGLDLEFVQSLQLNDGQVDLEMECRAGTSGDIQAYCLARVFVLPDVRINHTKMHVAVTADQLPAIKGSVFWPHLGMGLYWPSAPREIRPALTMDWPAACLDRPHGINNLVQPEGPETGWWLLSPGAVEKGRDNVLGFENPFVFYDLAADDDDWPELIIRHAYSPPGEVMYRVGDRYRISSDPRKTLQIVRYTWDQDNEGTWDYKLALIGTNPVDTVVQFPDFGVVSIPYAELPSVLLDSMRWEGQVFVQVEGLAERSPEGVYEWDSIPDLTDQFIFGLADELNVDIRDIRAGFRGEYAALPSATPRLYFSPIDRKMHLAGAEAGVCNVDGVTRVRYGDQDRDGYVDTWTLTEQRTSEDSAEGQALAEQAVAALYHADKYLIYTGNDRVRVVRATVPSSRFETLPPRDHGDWLELGRRLAEHGPAFASYDLAGMQEQFRGPLSEVRGASIEGFRPTDSGFRFVLRLMSGFRVVTDENGLGATGLASGSYLVTYDGSFRIESLTAPQISLRPKDWSCDPGSAQHLSWVTIRAQIRNEGLQDVESLPVRLLASREGGSALLLVAQEVSLEGQGTTTIETTWPPPESGNWRVWVEVDTENAVPAALDLGPMADLNLQVAPVAKPEMFRPLAPSDGVRFTWPVALLLGSTALVAVCVLVMILAHAARIPSEPATRED